jgi:hypothetical protein
VTRFIGESYTRVSGGHTGERAKKGINPTSAGAGDEQEELAEESA